MRPASLRKTVGPNNVRDPVTGFTCLHHAALNSHSECVKLILDYGAKVNAVDYKGSSALHLAAWAGNLQVVKTLLEYDQLSPPACSASTRRRRSSLAAEDPEARGLSPEARAPPQGVDVDLCNNDNQTPVSLAAQFGHDHVVAELLRHGANVHLRNNQLESALDLACLHGHLGTVRLLLDSSSILVEQLRQAASLAERPRELADQSLHQPASLARPSSVSFDSGAGESSSPVHERERRPSMGTWSSLLRGRTARQELANEQPSSNTGSPLQRLTAGTLSLRQKQVNPSRVVELTSQRRATTSVSLETGRAQMLDHSPLHYAIRRGQLDVANLLLRVYGANLLQLSNLGGCLHEVALNNGKHTQAIGFLFDYIASSGPTRCQQLLEGLLSLRDSQERTVFDVIKEMNNRSAHEIRRLIYEFSEQIKQQHLEQSAQVQVQPWLGGGRRHGLNSNGAAAAGTSPAGWRESSQHFSDINSFVTMKRAPRQQAASSKQNTWSSDQKQPAGRPQCWHDEFNLAAARSASNLAELGQSAQADSQPAPYGRRWPAEPSELAPITEQQQRVNQLVRSQTDCSHLMSRFLAAGERYSAQASPADSLPLDRRTINRHYHVYEHEFYPPRLLTSQPTSGQELRRADGVAAQLVHLGAPAELEPVRLSSRLSLNMDGQRRQQQQQPSKSQSSQQQPMDRFLGRHSRSNAPAQVLHYQADQRRSMVQQQQQAQSLESHMSEPQLFESTSKALLKDFDQLIGRELLNRDHREIIHSSLRGARGSSMQLTGVSLDMDQRGENLTVSGTRVVAKLYREQAERQASACSPSSTSSSSAPGSVAPPKPPRPSLQRNQVHRSTCVPGSSEPPRSRPPPPPSSLASPLKVIPPDSYVAGAGSSSSSNTGTEPAGLLKLARPAPVRVPTSLPLVGAGRTNAAASTDGDSGVCTSNSPASLSHDSEELAPNKVTAAFGQRARLQPAACMSPPSPNTAQLCIERALIPLAQANESQSVDQTTSPLICCLDQVEASSTNRVDRWLQADPASSPDSHSASLADYENCLDLQRQLRGARCSSLGNLLSVATQRLVCNDEADYVSSSASSPLNSLQSESTSSQTGTKEFMLRVLVDDEPSSTNEVFYINPNELKQISRATKRSQTDAETLTDDELSAAIDQESGLIRFTLRKRRGESQPEEPTNYQEQAQQVAATSEPKRTKLNENENDAQVHDEAEVQMRSFFQRKLAALMDYVQLLLANGFHFSMLNHDAFLNERLLSKVGIEQESHRQLILLAVKSETERLDLDALLDKLDQQAPLMDLLKRLHLPSERHLSSITAARAWASELPIGQAVRLTTALDQLEAKMSRLADEVDMELEGAEVEQTSSSSSRDSIKSIVVAPSYAHQVASNRQESKENLEPIAPSLVKPATSGSLVSEAARRLEAAALASNRRGSQDIIPVPATRRVKSAQVELTSSAKMSTEPDTAAMQDRQVAATSSAKPTAKVLAKWPPRSLQDVPTKTSVADRRSGLEQPDDTSTELKQPVAASTSSSRPAKPAPPAKPAKLAVGAKLNLHLASQRL